MSVKLTDETRHIIDEYFNNITPEELYDELTNRYGLQNIIFKSKLKAYRIKLKGYPLYFSPKGGSGNNLTKRGKVYTTAVNGLTPYQIYLNVKSTAFKMLKDKFPYEKSYQYDVVKFIFKEDDFEKVYI